MNIALLFVAWCRHTPLQLYAAAVLCDRTVMRSTQANR